MLADTMLRMLKDQMDWKLNTKTFKRSTNLSGVYYADVLATHLATQLPAFNSWRLDPVVQACSVDIIFTNPP